MLIWPASRNGFWLFSPLGKTPVLDVRGQALFESAVIGEYLEESFPRALPRENHWSGQDHRSWMEFSSSIFNNIAGFYSASESEALGLKRDALAVQFQRLESELSIAPYFSGERFSMVDAFFGPVFRYFDVFEQIENFGFFEHCPKVLAWRQHLAARKSVRRAVTSDYPTRLYEFLRNDNSALSLKLASKERREMWTLLVCRVNAPPDRYSAGLADWLIYPDLLPVGEGKHL